MLASPNPSLGKEGNNLPHDRNHPSLFTKGELPERDIPPQVVNLRRQNHDLLGHVVADGDVVFGGGYSQNAEVLGGVKNLYIAAGG